MKDKEFVVEKIRSQYMETGHTDLDALKVLDAKVKKPARVFGFAYGSIGAVIMGAGMSLCMTELGASLGDFALAQGIPVGVSGILLVSLAYPVFRKTLRTEREKIASDILKLTDDLLK